MINFKKLRESKSYNSKDFAVLIGISPSYYSQIEKNSRNINFELKNKLYQLFGEEYVNQYDEPELSYVNEDAANYLRRDVRLLAEDVELYKQENKVLRTQIEELTRTNNKLIQQILELTNKK